MKKFEDLKVGEKMFYLKDINKVDLPFEIPCHETLYYYEIQPAVIKDIMHINKETVDYSKPWENENPIEIDVNKIMFTVEFENNRIENVTIDFTWTKINDYSWGGWYANKEQAVEEIDKTYMFRLKRLNDTLDSVKQMIAFYEKAKEELQQ